jgi:phosphotransferase system HPr (HPr) family protein
MLLVELANKYAASVQIAKDGQSVDCKNMIEVLTLGAEQGIEVVVSADGDDADEAVESIAGLIEIGFGEE